MSSSSSPQDRASPQHNCPKRFGMMRPKDARSCEDIKNTRSEHATPELDNSPKFSSSFQLGSSLMSKPYSSQVNVSSLSNSGEVSFENTPRTHWRLQRPNSSKIRKYENRKLIMDGQLLKYATLEALIDYVTDTTTSTQDVRDIFAYTFSCVSDQNIVLGKLHDKLVENVSNVLVSHNILDVVLKWVNQMWNDQNPKTTAVLESFQNVLQLSGDTEMEGKFFDALERKAFQAQVVEETEMEGMSLYTSEPSFLLIDPLMIARQMTMMEFDLFRKIKPAELYAWNKKEKEKNSPNVYCFVNHFNDVSNMFVTMLLEASDVAKRVCVAQQILEVGRGFIVLNNFNGIMEVASAFGKAAVHRLRLTKRFLNDEAITILKRIEGITNNSNNFKSLREAQKLAVGATLPYLGMYLTDLLFTEDMSSSAVYTFETLQSKTETTLINFEKCRVLSGLICSIVRYQNTPYIIKHSQIIDNYLTRLQQSTIQGDNEQFKISQEKESKEFICESSGLPLTRIYELEHLHKYKLLRIEKPNQPNGTKMKLKEREVVMWVLLPANKHSYNYPIKIAVSLDAIVGDVVKELRNENYQFFLAPTKLLQVGVALSPKMSIEEALLQTQAYRNDPEDFFCVFEKNDAISLLFLCKPGSPNMMLKYKTIVDPTAPLAHSIPSLVHLFRAKTDEFAFLQVDENCKIKQWINPFSKAQMCCDMSKLLVFPVSYLQFPKGTLLKRCTPHPLNNTYIHVMSCVGYRAKQFETKSGFVPYKIVYTDGFLFFYKNSSEPNFVLNLGYYQLRLICNPKTHTPTLLLTKAIDITNNPEDVPTYAMISESIENTLLWYKTFCRVCLSNYQNRLVGINIERITSDILENLIDSLYLSPYLQCNSDVFEVEKMQRMEIVGEYEETKNVSSFTVVELSQILMIFMEYLPDPLISQASQQILEVGIVQFDTPKKARTAIGIAKVLMKWSDGRKKMMEKIGKVVSKAMTGDPSLERMVVNLIPEIAKMPIPKEDSTVYSIHETESVTIFNDKNQELMQHVTKEILDELAGIQIIKDGQIGPKKTRSKYLKSLKKEETRQTVNFDKSGIPDHMINMILSEEGETTCQEDEEDLVISAPTPQLGFENEFVVNFQMGMRKDLLEFKNFRRTLKSKDQRALEVRKKLTWSATNFVRTKDLDDKSVTTLKKMLLKRDEEVQFF
ncbi:ras GTP exchange factor, son of sevenless, putative [Entamoeba invadens IP1]|uniref:ras GTP exchange factor, son of sevenless, putative n=1 Tax=Entamoeba invadens IP1 TaxID=370355 RepID=UPI0002C3E4E0|nr:ras GTP exchange factor, son of sevenless, putative [Entamoeba invadens IP1]ELP94214.1 ras GTP exchange factor, son of sevenless, putative [Entamoeba invadens IP1]|eukprot:XP_004260985.1 ras GTP exchange factor, son of sevenless, putative [Entamoeba invadens IP1]